MRFVFYVPRDDWVIDDADSGMRFRINICAELIYKETGLKNPDGVASFGQDRSFARFDLGLVHMSLLRFAFFFFFSSVRVFFVILTLHMIINRKFNTTPIFRGKIGEALFVWYFRYWLILSILPQNVRRKTFASIPERRRMSPRPLNAPFYSYLFHM